MTFSYLLLLMLPPVLHLPMPVVRTRSRDTADHLLDERSMTVQQILSFMVIIKVYNCVWDPWFLWQWVFPGSPWFL